MMFALELARADIARRRRRWRSRQIGLYPKCLVFMMRPGSRPTWLRCGVGGPKGKRLRGLAPHALLPLDDCLYVLQATIPNLTRSSLHRCLHRHGIGRLPDVEGDKPAKRKFKSYAIGYFQIDIVEVRTEQGKLHMFVAIDRISKFAETSCCG